MHRVIGRSRLCIAPVATGRFRNRGFLVIGRFDFRKVDRIFPKTVELLFLARKDLPLRILRHGNPARAEGRAVRQGIVAPFQKGPNVVGRPVPVLHGHDDGGAAEGAVTGRKDLGIVGTHGFPAGRHAVAAHQATGL